MKKPTTRDVAEWMLAQIDTDEMLPHEYAVGEIGHLFGEEEFTYLNDSGNPVICKPVLDEFAKLSSDRIVWSRSEKHWRPREENDLPGRMQP